MQSMTSEQKMAAWKDRFRTFSIYLDGFEPMVANKLGKQIKALGATVEPFLNTSVTHMVTTNIAGLEDALGAKDASPKTKAGMLRGPGPKRQASQDPIQLARRLDIRVWPFSKLEKIISMLLPAQPSRGLAQALHQEKLYGVSTRNDPDRGKDLFQPFKGYYLMVEDVSNKYKPIIAKELRPPRTPTCRRGPSSTLAVIRANLSLPLICPPPRARKSQSLRTMTAILRTTEKLAEMRRTAKTRPPPTRL
ncbi:hypothetical protein BC831DRAFT_76440 [Entophlyctis helioformis]|nr:hypothetical protein BC831DRAFT_76440 [Entophlyctis helioformis]